MTEPTAFPPAPPSTDASLNQPSPVTTAPAPSSAAPTIPTPAAPTIAPAAPPLTTQPVTPPVVPTALPEVQIQPIVSGAPFTNMAPRKAYQGPKPVVLLVLDGWGIGPNNAGNAIARANTTNLNKYWLAFPHTQLAASGEAVGLPHGEDGNTETGHLNIGAGSIVYQDLPRINMSIADGSFYQTEAFLKACEHVKKNNSTMHLMGLIGSGGVHSNIEHLYALLNLCKQQNISQVYIHGFTDGRDSPPTSGVTYVQQITEWCAKLGIGKLATLMGRYYGMDRDKRWERIEKAYDALTVGSSSCTNDPMGAMQAQYAQGTTDEFIEPVSICNEDGSTRLIKDNDAVIFFNYRIDRPRELTYAFMLPTFEQGIRGESFDPYTIKYEKTHLKQYHGGTTFKRKKVVSNLFFVTMTRYEENLPVAVAFPPQQVKNPICKVFAENGLKQLRMAETEKEKFVTYYMNGQKDEIYPGEDRAILPSKGAKSYDQVPEMSAREIASEMINRIRTQDYDVIICNLANADMVAHTGNLQASIVACNVIDEVVGEIVKEVFNHGGVVFITADHGNAEELISNSTGEVDTEHSIYPVPFMIIGKQFMNNPVMLPTGILADIAPTMLHVMGIPKPENMTGRALI